MLLTGAAPGFPGQDGRADLPAVACERLPPLARGQVPDQPQLVARRRDRQPAVNRRCHAGQPAAVTLNMQVMTWSARHWPSLKNLDTHIDQKRSQVRPGFWLHTCIV